MLVVIVFGWTGGKQLVGSSYTDAKVRAADMKEQRKEKRQAKRQEKRGRFGHTGDGTESAAPEPESSP